MERDPASTSALDPDSIAGYLADEIVRALAAHDRAAPGTVQRLLPLGEMLALFNFADQFGLLDSVRAALDRRLGSDAYARFSDAMKAALLDRGAGPARGEPGARPDAGRGPRPRPGQQGGRGPREQRGPRGSDRDRH